jgi:hypothetical protein
VILGIELRTLHLLGRFMDIFKEKSSVFGDEPTEKGE